MCFVGRRREMGRLIRCLKQGRNVIVSGIYGSGRTRMVRQVAAAAPEGFLFIFTDFSRTPGAVCRQLLDALGQRSSSSRRHVSPLRYRTGRNLLAGLEPAGRGRPVIVLDNIGRLTRQQLTFLRELNLGGRYLFVAIVESFLPAPSLFLIRACLYPSEMISVGRLPLREACEFFRRFSAEHGLNAADDDLLVLAKASRGYPLGMREAAERLLARGRRNGRSNVPQEEGSPWART